MEREEIEALRAEVRRLLHRLAELEAIRDLTAPLEKAPSGERAATSALASNPDSREASAASSLGQENSALFHALWASDILGIAIADAATGEIYNANDEYLRIVGRTREEVEAGLVNWKAITPPEDLAAEERHTNATPSGAPVRPFEKSYLRPDGTRVPVIVFGAFLDRERRKAVAFVTDNTERKRGEEERQKLQDQLVHAQKMESVGRLAGGVAHDFNNLLTPLLGYSEILLRRMPRDHPDRALVAEMHRMAERAATLTRQLLAFSRRQVMQPALVDLNAVVQDVAKMLRHLIGEDINLVVLAHPGLWHVFADAGQMEQVLVNLAVNARDAMPEGGVLTIETANLHLDHDAVGPYGSLVKGDYVTLSVTDNGIGMDRATMAQVFEPFFTTKPPGKGTGLGLSTVYGIVTQSGGRISVYSEPGHGTTFRIALPRADKEPVGAADTAEETPAGGTETILVVEDDSDVRALIEAILRDQGYEVTTAANGSEALAIAATHRDRFDLVLTDVVMPGMNGPALWAALSPTQPRAAVLYMSGYTENGIVHHGVLQPGVHFIQKPFSAAALARKIREVLEARS